MDTNTKPQYQKISPFIKREIYAKAVEHLDAAKETLESIGYMDGDALFDEINEARKSTLFAQYLNEGQCK